MKKIVLVLLSILILATMLIGAQVSASAESADIIPVPNIPAINKPYKTVEELGIDFEAIDAYFPKNIDIRHEGGKLYAEDIGAGTVEIYDPEWISLELIDGYWTAEVETVPAFVFFSSGETEAEDKFWRATYDKNGMRDPYITLNDYVNNVHISFSFEYGNVTVMYQSGDCYYEDRYEDGVLETHGVSNSNDTESINKVLYDVNGNIAYCTLYIGGYYYYFPGQGWSSNWEFYAPSEAPAGYEDKDETYFAANKPSLICKHIEWDDATCTTPKTCKKCGETEGEALGHDYDDGVVTADPTCSAVGTKTFTCTRNSTHTMTEDVAIDENAHAWNDGAVTTDPTCSAVGTKTFTCTHDSAHTMTEDVAIDENAHAWNDGVVTADPTCTAKGERTFTCTHNSEHIRIEDIDPVGHKYDNACDSACNVCNEARTPAEHLDADEDRACDECGVSLSNDGLSGGAIAGIAVGSATVLGLGGFSLFWFVIRKKKWSDLAG